MQMDPRMIGVCSDGAIPRMRDRLDAKARFPATSPGRSASSQEARPCDTARVVLETARHEPASFGHDDTARATRIAVLGVFVLVTAAIGAHLIDFGVYDLRIRVMNAGLGSSPVAWVSPAALAVALASTILLARRRQVTVALVPVLAIVLVLSTRHLGESLPHWQVLLLPPLGLALFLLWREAEALDRLAARTCRTGCVLLVCAFALHVFGAALLRSLGIGVDSWPYQVKVALKEGLEIAGWLLVASGLAATAWGTRVWRGPAVEPAA